jgi:hypothetical protein
MVAHKERTVSAAGRSPRQFTCLKREPLPSKGHQTQIFGQIDDHAAATRNVDLHGNPLEWHPFDGHLSRGDADQLLAQLDAGTRWITLDPYPVGTADKNHNTQHDNSLEEHGSHCSASGHPIPSDSMRYSILVSLLFAALITTPATAGPKNTKKAQRTKHVKQERKEIEFLQRSTELYWEGVRWNNAEKSSAFVENPTTRMLFQQWLEDRFASQRVMSARVLRVDVGPPLENDSAQARKALISVSVEGYTLPEQVLKNELVQQVWYRAASGWWLEWAPTETESTPDTP